MNQYKNPYIVWLILVSLLNIFFLKLPLFHIAVSMTLAAMLLYTFLSKGLNVKWFSVLLDAILIALAIDAMWLMKSTDYRGIAIIAAIITGRFTKGFLLRKTS